MTGDAAAVEGSAGASDPAEAEAERDDPTGTAAETAETVETADQQGGEADDPEASTRDGAAEPPEPNEGSGPELSWEERHDRITEAYKLVPEIGSGWRWYDFPYRLLWWLSTGWRRKVLTRRMLERATYGINWLAPFDEHRRHKVLETDFDFTVPDDEHVSIPRIWVVELFPPSEVRSLEQAMEKSRWDRRRILFRSGESNTTMLTKSRAGSGWIWWNVADIASIDGRGSSPDGTREKLPPEFTFINLKAIQLGEGLTAVVGSFSLSDEAAGSVDKVWHRPHEPQIAWVRGRPRAEDREWAAYRSTQASRASLHSAAREWMNTRCSGFFASAGAPQPSLDLVLMDKFDPLTGDEVPRNLRDAFRALGLSEHNTLERRSDNLPRLAYVPASRSLERELKPERTMALWGQLDAVAGAASNLGMYGGTDGRAIASRYSKEIQGFLVTVAVSGYLEIARAQYATLRDRARSEHGRFKLASIVELRDQLLTLSLDLSSLHENLKRYWGRGYRTFEEATFTLDYAPYVKRRNPRLSDPVQSETMNEVMRTDQQADFEDLVKADRDYRDILSTVATLNVARDSARTGRRALIVAAASLLIATATILGSTFGDGSVYQWIVSRF